MIWESSPYSMPLVRGLNEIRVVLARCDPDRKGPVEVGEFEITVEPSTPL